VCHNDSFLLLSDYLFNFNLGVLLTVTILLPVVLTALHFEDDDLLTLHKWINHFYYYLGTFYGWCTHRDSALIVDEEHFVKFNSLAFFGFLDAVYKELLALLNLKLLTVNFYDCVHFYYYKRVFPQGVRPSAGTSSSLHELNRLQNYSK